MVAFNWPKVLGGTALALVGLREWRRLPLPARLVVLGASVWTPLSVLASWWVYDLSPLRHWRFLEGMLPSPPHRVLLVVAGFDEVSTALRRALPGSVVDVVDVVRSPDASVRRARRLYPTPAPVVAPDDLGREVRAGARPGYDLVLFAQSAHELRDPQQRVTALRRARQALGPGGSVVVVEHHRDLANVVAFGPGAWHFETTGTWRRAEAGAGLRRRSAARVTPLVRVEVLAP